MAEILDPGGYWIAKIIHDLEDIPVKCLEETQMQLCHLVCAEMIGLKMYPAGDRRAIHWIAQNRRIKTGNFIHVKMALTQLGRLDWPRIHRSQRYDRHRAASVHLEMNWFLQTWTCCPHFPQPRDLPSLLSVRQIAFQ